jgi:hypothetical protein
MRKKRKNNKQKRKRKRHTWSRDTQCNGGVCLWKDEESSPSIESAPGIASRNITDTRDVKEKRHVTWKTWKRKDEIIRDINTYSERKAMKMGGLLLGGVVQGKKVEFR